MDDNTSATPNTSASLPPATDAQAPAAPTNATGLTGVTDLHRTKVPPDDPRLKLDRPKSRTLRPGPALAAAGVLAAVVATVIVVAVAPSNSTADDTKKQDDVAQSTDIPLPDALRQPAEAPALKTGAATPQRTFTDSAPNQFPAESAQPPGASNGGGHQDTRAAEELARSRGSSVFAAIDDSPAENTTVRQQQGPNPATAPPGEPGAAAGGSAREHSPDPNMQERKNDFLARDGVSSAEYLDKSVTLPRSPYEIKAGTVIPTVLITGINSDLPGQVVGQVRENVYDTISGNYLLIPQGSRVLAAYDSMVAWGQERVLICWNRIIRPDGSSITLDCMPGVDLGGNAGFTDEVDNHWWRIISGAVFSSLLAATAQRSQGDVSTYQPSVSQAWAGNAAGQVNQAGQQITARNLQIQPTITVRPGFSVNVLVSKDIVLPPYNRGGAP